MQLRMEFADHFGPAWMGPLKNLSLTFNSARAVQLSPTQKDQGMEVAVDEIQLRTDEAN